MIPCSLFLCLAVASLIQAKTVEIAVLRYEALNYQEIENLEHLSYNFEFCACNRHFQGNLPNRSPDCECGSSQTGKRVIDSTPQAIFSKGCIHSYTPGKCLNAKFTGPDPGRRLFVKVTIGRNIVFTFPTYQELAPAKYRTISTLSSSVGTDMRITYIISSVDDKSPSTSPSTIPSWLHPQPKEEAKSRPSSVFEMNSLYNFLREKLKSGKKTEKEPTVVKYNEEKTTRRSNSRTTTPSPTRPTTTKAVTTPKMTTKMNKHSDISDVTFISSVNQVKDFLLRESIKDRVDPTTFDITTLKKEILFYHNVYRSMHDAVDVVRDSSMDSAAQRWSDHLAERRNCLVHESPRSYGENLFFFASSHLPKPETVAKAIIQSFYMEGNGYNYNKFVPMAYFKTGHFSQLIWRNSRQIGVGVSIKRHGGGQSNPCQTSRPSYMIYVCVKYDPAGNVQSKEDYFENVRARVRA